MISKIKYKNEEFSYSVFEYLYPYLVRLIWQGKLEINEDEVVLIPDDTVSELKSLLEELAIDLLEEFYIEPKQDKVVEFRGRYESIKLRSKKYTLDITTNPKDRVVYKLFVLLDWIGKVSHPA